MTSELPYCYTERQVLPDLSLAPVKDTFPNLQPSMRCILSCIIIMTSSTAFGLFSTQTWVPRELLGHCLTCYIPFSDRIASLTALNMNVLNSFLRLVSFVLSTIKSSANGRLRTAELKKDLLHIHGQYGELYADYCALHNFNAPGGTIAIDFKADSNNVSDTGYLVSYTRLGRAE